jgi:hypothetical protein
MSNLDKFQPDRESNLEKLFGDVPLEAEVLVPLPSEGRFYLNGKPEVLVSPIKFEDEKQLASSAKSGINPINLMLSKCIKGIDINSLLLIDKLVLLLKIREISYGENYPVTCVCPKCAYESDVNVNLSQLLIKHIPPEVQDPREITLPKLKKQAKVRFPKVSDEPNLNSDEQVYNNLWRFVTELNGSSDPVFISKAIPKMHIMDIKFILNQVMRLDLGLDPKFILRCTNCGGESVLSVPINENFFSVT